MPSSSSVVDGILMVFILAWSANSEKGAELGYFLRHRAPQEAPCSTIGVLPLFFSLAVKGNQNGAAPPVIAEFAEVNSLPGA